ncbi:MAG: hypothetical protein ABF446_08340 [Acetobacter orientalis]|uniref:hypothetical protein n=1 Tax=Acetobacter orientalis TaxID=146474 RepID=UPI0039E96F1B
MKKSSQTQIAARTKKILALHASGLTSGQIAERGDVTPYVVYATLKKHGLTPNGIVQSSALSRTRETIREKNAQGLANRAIARLLKISPTAVAYHIAKMGLRSHATRDEVGTTSDEQALSARLALGDDPLPVGHPIAVDAMWRGLEKYREPLAL